MKPFVLYNLILIFLSENILGDIFQNAAYNEATIHDFIENDVFFEILHPETLQYTYRLRQAKNFGTAFRYPQRGLRLVVTDPEECCSSLYNSPLVEGAVALVTRGSCSFVSKAISAERAGALAIIVTDTDPNNDASYIEMVADGTGREPNIPAFFLLGRNGEVIRHTLGREHEPQAIINIPVNLTNVPISKLNQPPWIVW